MQIIEDQGEVFACRTVQPGAQCCHRGCWLVRVCRHRGLTWRGRRDGGLYCFHQSGKQAICVAFVVFMSQPRSTTTARPRRYRGGLPIAGGTNNHADPALDSTVYQFVNQRTLDAFIIWVGRLWRSKRHHRYRPPLVSCSLGAPWSSLASQLNSRAPPGEFVPRRSSITAPYRCVGDHLVVLGW